MQERGVVKILIGVEVKIDMRLHRKISNGH